jgi:hypothetical protein
VERALALALLLGVLPACVVAGSKDAGLRIRQALVDLAQAGFEFDADVRFRTDPYAVCAGVSCATIVVLKERRTVLLAKGALDSDAALRASLLDIWERYESPHPDSVCDELRGMLRVVRDGPRVGVDDVGILRRAHHAYRRLHVALGDTECGDPPHPDELAFP